MRALLATPAILVALAIVAGASHLPDCHIVSQDPATYRTATVPEVGTFYAEERSGIQSEAGPVPLTGFLLGAGTWAYQEDNGIPGLQPGAQCSFVSCGTCVPDDDLCLLTSEDPIIRDYCGHQPDRLIV